MHNKSGEYTVSFGYWLVNLAELISEANMLPSLNEIRGHIWDLNTSQKIKLFMWRVLSGAISVADNLGHK